jgi:hypothetical protein
MSEAWDDDFDLGDDLDIPSIQPAVTSSTPDNNTKDESEPMTHKSVNSGSDNDFDFDHDSDDPSALSLPGNSNKNSSKTTTMTTAATTATTTSNKPASLKESIRKIAIQHKKNRSRKGRRLAALDDDFHEGDGLPPESAPLPTGKKGEALVGISADPSMREAWDDDFEFAFDDDEQTINADDSNVKTKPLETKDDGTLSLRKGEALVGISADPSMREAWDDDFEFAFDDDEQTINASNSNVKTNPLESKDGGTLSLANNTASLTLNLPSNENDSDMDGFDDSEEEVDWDTEMGLVDSNDKDTAEDSPSSEEEDWDKEFNDADADFEQSLGMLRNLIQGKQQVIGQEIGVPKRYRLFDAIELGAAQSVTKYPPPSETYSVHPSDGFKRMSGKQISDWLTGIAVSKLKTYVTGGRSKRRPSMKNLNSTRRNTQKLQAGWSDTYLREAWTLYRNSHDHGKLWVLLSEFFETLCLVGQEQKTEKSNNNSYQSAGFKRGRSNSDKDSHGWNHIFQNALKLLRLGCRARLQMLTFLDNSNGGNWSNDGGGSGDVSSYNKSGSKRSDYRRANSYTNDSTNSSLSDSRRSVRTAASSSTTRDRNQLVRSRYRRMLNILYELFPRYSLTIDILEIRAAAHLLSSTSSYFIYIVEDGRIDAVIEKEDAISCIDWTKSPAYREARMIGNGARPSDGNYIDDNDDDDDDDDIKRGTEVIAKLCTSISNSSIEMHEENSQCKNIKNDIHPLMKRLNEIAAENGGDVTYKAVKALLVSEFTQEVFDQHKISVRWELEHMAQYVTEDVDSQFAERILKKTMSEQANGSDVHYRSMLSSSLLNSNGPKKVSKAGTKPLKKSKSLREMKKINRRMRSDDNGGLAMLKKSQSFRLMKKASEPTDGSASKSTSLDSENTVGSPPWKARNTCVEGSLLYVQVAALTSLQCLLNGRSPLTGIEDESMLDTLPKQEDYQDTTWKYSTVNAPILGLLSDIDDPHLIKKNSHNTVDDSSSSSGSGDGQASSSSSPFIDLNVTPELQPPFTPEVASSFSSTDNGVTQTPRQKRRSTMQETLFENNTDIDFESLRHHGDFERDSYRIEILLPGYIALPPHCLLKAQTAYVIGIHFLKSQDKEDWAVSERILFECVYCLDRMETKLENIGILSDLGIEALVSYGDALCKNDKYAFGILAYEAAITAYKLVNSSDFMKMTRRLCGICLENRDWDKALQYHLIILHGAKKLNNTTEVVYITERISTMQCDLGNFDMSQSSLIVAGLTLRKTLKEQEEKVQRLVGNSKNNKKKDLKKNKNKNKNKDDKNDKGLTSLTSFVLNEKAGIMHSHFFTLRTKLAQVYLAREQLPEAIILLQKLQKNNMKRDKKIEVQMLLVRCFLRLREFDECERELNNIQDELRMGAASDEHAHGNAQRISSSPASKIYEIDVDQIDNLTRLKRVRSLIASIENMKNTLKNKHNTSGSNKKLKKHRRHHTTIKNQSSMPKFDRGIERTVRSVEYLKLRARNLAYGNQCHLALGWLNLALDVVRSSSLGELGSLHYLRGKIYKRCNHQQVIGLHLVGVEEVNEDRMNMFPLKRASNDIFSISPCRFSKSSIGSGRNSFLSSHSSLNGELLPSSSRAATHARSLDTYIRGVSAFQAASKYFHAVDDHHRQAKALVQESSLHLYQLFAHCKIRSSKNSKDDDVEEKKDSACSLETVSNQLADDLLEHTQFKREEKNRLEEEEATAVNDSKEEQFGEYEEEEQPKQEISDPYEWVETTIIDGSSILASIESSTNLAIELAADVADPMLMIQCLHTISELRCLQGYEDQSVAYWEEAYKILTSVFLVEKINATSKDIFDSNMINKWEELPKVPSTFAPLPAGFVNKLATSAECLVSTLIGLADSNNTSFLIEYSRCFLLWNILDTQKWELEKKLPRPQYVPVDDHGDGDGDDATATSRGIKLKGKSATIDIGRISNASCMTSSNKNGVTSDRSSSGGRDGESDNTVGANDINRSDCSSSMLRPDPKFDSTKASIKTRTASISSSSPSLTRESEEKHTNTSAIPAPPSKKRTIFTPSKKGSKKYEEKKEKIWRHFYCVKTHNKNYSAGVLSLNEVSKLNYKRIETLRADVNKKKLREGSEVKNLNIYVKNDTTTTGAAAKESKEEQNKNHEKEHNQLLQQYPETTFFLARIRHRLIYFEPNTGIVRVWNPSTRDIDDNDDDTNNDSRKRVSIQQLHRHSSRSIISNMYIQSHLDSKGYLEKGELLSLLRHNYLSKYVEISTYTTGIHYLMKMFGTATTYQLVSILLNEMPLIIVSSNPNRLIHVMSSMLSLIRPFKWQHMYIPVIPTSCANMIGGAIDPLYPFFVGCDPNAVQVLEGEINASAVRDNVSVPGITIVKLDISNSNASTIDSTTNMKPKVVWGREFDNEMLSNKELLSKMKPISTKDIPTKTSMNPLHQTSRLKRSRVDNDKRMKMKKVSLSSSSKNNNQTNVGKKVIAIHIPTRYVIMCEKKQELKKKNSWSRLMKVTNKESTTTTSTTNFDNDIKEKTTLLCKSMYCLFEDILSNYKLFVENNGDNNKKLFDMQTFIDFSIMIRPDCQKFVKRLINTDMFIAYLKKQSMSGEKSSNRKNMIGPFEKKFNSSIAHKLNMLVTETGMTLNVRKEGYLLVTYFDLVDESESKPIPEKPLKFKKEKKRFVVVDRQRLTWYKSRSIKNIKNSINLDSQLTRMTISPPLPKDVLNGTNATSGLINYTKPFTIKIENDEKKLIIYLRCNDEITFRDWFQSVSTRLLPNHLKSKISNYDPYKR